MWIRHMIYVYLCISVYVYVNVNVIFNNRSGVLYWDFKHEAIAEYFRSDKARTVSFPEVF